MNKVRGVPEELGGAVDEGEEAPPSLSRLLRVAAGWPDPGPEPEQPTAQQVDDAIRRLAKAGD